MYRLTTLLISTGLVACIGVASASGLESVPETVREFFGGKPFSGGRSEVADLPGSRLSGDRGERGIRSSSGGDSLPAGFFSEIFDLDRSGFPDDMSASLDYSVGSFTRSNPGYSFGSGSWTPGARGGHSGYFGSGGGQGGSAAGSGGGSGGSGGGGGDSGSGGVPQGYAGLGSTAQSDPVEQDGVVVPYPVGSLIVPPVQLASRGPVKDILLGVAPKDIVPPVDVRDPNPAQDPAPVPNPEPGTLILGGMGLAIMAAARRRMKRKQGE